MNDPVVKKLASAEADKNEKGGGDELSDIVIDQEHSGTTTVEATITNTANDNRQAVTFGDESLLR